MLTLTDLQLSGVAIALGWRGQIVHDVDLLGERVHVVANLTPACDGGQKVELVGVLAARRGWRSAMRAASGFVAFASRAVVLPGSAPVGSHLQAVAAYTGVGIVLAHPTKVQVAASPSPPAARSRTLAHDLVEEAVYSRLLPDAAVAVH